VNGARVYTVIFAPGAGREFRNLSQDVQERIRVKLGELAHNPRPRDSKKLKGFKGRYRVRVGDWRIIYKIEDNILIVTVTRVAHRSQAYD
jgi:mRNA interferase RelE/StbE